MTVRCPRCHERFLSQGSLVYDVCIDCYDKQSWPEYAQQEDLIRTLKFKIEELEKRLGYET